MENCVGCQEVRLEISQLLAISSRRGSWRVRMGSSGFGGLVRVFGGAAVYAPPPCDTALVWQVRGRDCSTGQPRRQKLGTPPDKVGVLPL